MVTDREMTWDELAEENAKLKKEIGALKSATLYICSSCKEVLPETSLSRGVFSVECPKCHKFTIILLDGGQLNEQLSALANVSSTKNKKAD